MKHRFKHPERLEAREMLDAGGLSWTDTSQLTLSLAPDGTDIAGEPSRLFAKFDAVARRAEWTESILEAFQTWAKPTTANIGVVNERTIPGSQIEPKPVGADTGTGAAGDGANELATGFPFGTPGPRTQDPRFGDIRIGARPLSSDVKAIAISNDVLTSGTWSGDVVFNSNAEFDNLDQIFALALHEAGHVFGLDHNGNRNSPMFEHGVPEALRPTVEDRAEMRLRHGSRVQDQYDLGLGFGKETGCQFGRASSAAPLTFCNRTVSVTCT